MMSHDERLPECKETHCRIENKVDKHIAESVDYRSKADKQEAQIQTINKAYEQTLNNQVDMYKRLGDLDVGMEGLKGMIQAKHDAIKIWIMAGIISGLLVVAASIVSAILYTGGMRNQVEIDKARIDKIEALHMKP